MLAIVLLIGCGDCPPLIITCDMRAFLWHGKPLFRRKVTPAERQNSRGRQSEAGKCQTDVLMAVSAPCMRLSCSPMKP